MNKLSVAPPWEGVSLGNLEPVQEGPSIPANVEAERAVLGSILIDPGAINKANEILTSKDFFRERHQLIFDAMQYLAHANQPIEFVGLQRVLEDSNHLGAIGGPAYLTDLIASIPTAMYVEHYANIVLDESISRQLIYAAGAVAELAYSRGIPSKKKLDQAQQLLLQVVAKADGRNGLEQVGPIIVRVMENLDKRSQQDEKMLGLPTGFAMLDRILGGLCVGLIILAARPGQGKSALAMSMIANAIRKHNARVAFFSLEMTKEQLVERLLSAESATAGTKLRTGELELEDFERLNYAANELMLKPLYIDDNAESTVLQIRSKARRLYAEQGLDLIVVDYMQLMHASEERMGSRQEEVAAISRGLKALSKELNVPVLALAQLSRAVESRADKRPILSDLRESGQVEQDADAVLFIYREDYYIEDTDRQNIADILIAKHREGATGTVSLFFRKEITQFRELEITRTDLEY